MRTSRCFASAFSLDVVSQLQITKFYLTVSRCNSLVLAGSNLRIRYNPGMRVAAAPKRMARDDRREALLDAAVRVLQHQVLADLSFESVAEEAGVSKTLPYSYFESPAEIAIALFERVVGTIDRTTDHLVGSSLSFDDKVRATLHLWSDAIESGGQLVHRVLDGKAVAALQYLIKERDRHSVEIWSDAIAEEFCLTGSDAEFVAVIITSAATATLRYWADNGLDRDEVIEQFLRAIRATAREFSRT